MNNESQLSQLPAPPKDQFSSQTLKFYIRRFSTLLYTLLMMLFAGAMIFLYLKVASLRKDFHSSLAYQIGCQVQDDWKLNFLTDVTLSINQVNECPVGYEVAFSHMFPSVNPICSCEFVNQDTLSVTYQVQPSLICDFTKVVNATNCTSYQGIPEMQGQFWRQQQKICLKRGQYSFFTSPSTCNNQTQKACLVQNSAQICVGINEKCPIVQMRIFDNANDQALIQDFQNTINTYPNLYDSNQSLYFQNSSFFIYLVRSISISTTATATTTTTLTNSSNNNIQISINSSINGINGNDGSILQETDMFPLSILKISQTGTFCADLSSLNQMFASENVDSKIAPLGNDYNVNFETSDLSHDFTLQTIDSSSAQPCLGADPSFQLIDVLGETDYYKNNNQTSRYAYLSDFWRISNDFQYYLGGKQYTAWSLHCRQMDDFGMQQAGDALNTQDEYRMFLAFFILVLINVILACCVMPMMECVRWACGGTKYGRWIGRRACCYNLPNNQVGLAKAKGITEQANIFDRFILKKLQPGTIFIEIFFKLICAPVLILLIVTCNKNKDWFSQSVELKCSSDAFLQSVQSPYQKYYNSLLNYYLLCLICWVYQFSTAILYILYRRHSAATQYDIFVGQKLLMKERAKLKLAIRNRQSQNNSVAAKGDLLKQRSSFNDLEKQRRRMPSSEDSSGEDEISDSSSSDDSFTADAKGQASINKTGKSFNIFTVLKIHSQKKGEARCDPNNQTISEENDEEEDEGNDDNNVQEGNKKQKKEGKNINYKEGSSERSEADISIQKHDDSQQPLNKKQNQNQNYQQSLSPGVATGRVQNKSQSDLNDKNQQNLKEKININNKGVEDRIDSMPKEDQQLIAQQNEELQMKGSQNSPQLIKIQNKQAQYQQTAQKQEVALNQRAKEQPPQDQLEESGNSLKTENIQSSKHNK